MNTKLKSSDLHIECEPGRHLNRLQFSVLPIRIRVHHPENTSRKGLRVVIRTNLNQAHQSRLQVIDKIERGLSYSTDFYDIVATYRSDEQAYGVDVLLGEVGYFEYKVRVESVGKGNPWVKWADGPNQGVSVTPLPYGRDNSIYCAFIRQFHAEKGQASLVKPELEENIQSLEQQGAFVLPPGGNFENFNEALPFIINELGMKIIHLLPINPVPTSYGRMGMYGSPYATTDFFGIDHTYATFSRYKTIEDQFIDLTSTIHGLGARVFLDMVVNHTGWASSIHFTHRHWRVVDENRKIVSPGAWGVVWGDLVELDYDHYDLWEYMAKVFLTWCQRGIDGFRLDAGYMVPLEVWQYIISKVREEFPNTLFLLEGLGGPWETTEKLLTQGQMNWAYSELFQNHSQGQIRDYLGYAQKVSSGKGVMVHYAETHDNDRLAKKGKIYARMRLYLSALTSFSGSWGFTNGVEWLATEKIDVHRNSGLNWGSKDNLVDEIAMLNRILKENPAFWECDNIVHIDVGDKDLFAFIRQNSDKSNCMVCIINLNTQEPRHYHWNFGDLLDQERGMVDLLANQWMTAPDDKVLSGQCPPGGCLLYRLNETAEIETPQIPALFEVDYDRITLIYQILLQRFKPHEVGRIGQEKLLREVHDFRKFIALVQTSSLNELIKGNITEQLANIDNDLVEATSSVWTFRDSSKEFIIPGDKWLIAHTFVPCTAYLKTDVKKLTIESIPADDNLGHLSFFPPEPKNIRSMLTFYWKLERENMIQRRWQDQDYPILSIPSGRIKPTPKKHYPLSLAKSQLQDAHAKVFLANGLGSLCQVPATPAEINSKYDTLFSLATDPHDPTQRVSLVKMVKETVQVGQKLFDLDKSFFVRFTRYPHPTWEFTYDDGEYRIGLQRTLVFLHNQNMLTVRYKVLEANHRLTLTSKFYLEYRPVHHSLVADDRLRQQYFNAMSPFPSGQGLTFEPQEGIKLSLTAKRGTFIEQPQWIYGQRFSDDAQRGLEDISDLFSPGMFNCQLQNRDSQVICMTTEPEVMGRFSHSKNEQLENHCTKELLAGVPSTASHKDPLVRILVGALDQFIHKLNGSWRLISGYPWLGQNTRESLQSVGGLLAGGREDVAREIIIEAAKTQRDGLIADWLVGGPESYRCVESSLRLILSAQDYVNATGDDSFWSKGVDQRRCLRDVLCDMMQRLSQSDCKGLSLDVRSGLLFCPEGSTWMNTTNPQATMRGGYPIEIQALWHQSLAVLARIDPLEMERISVLRDVITESIGALFWCQRHRYLADVLRCGGSAAVDAIKDHSLRFNQLAVVAADLVPTDQARLILKSVAEKLLIPGGVRSLSEDLLELPLEIRSGHGQLLSNPDMPYQGQCIGNEQARRLAYHNGTAWPWAYLSFVEAQVRVDDFSDPARQQGLSYLEPIWGQLEVGGIGTLPEMLDGNYPHTPRGCFAHALTVAETLRVYMMLLYPNSTNSPTPSKTLTPAQTV
jgi:starch synthase (maltosyl-transferring)